MDKEPEIKGYNWIQGKDADFGIWLYPKFKLGWKILYSWRMHHAADAMYPHECNHCIF